MKKFFTALCLLLTVFAPVSANSLALSSQSNDDSLGRLIADLLFLENSIVNYDDYPFADGDYIKYTDFSPDLSVEKPWRYEVETSAFYFPATGTFGTESRIDGIIYRYFGPELENRLLWNPSTGRLTGDLKLGFLWNIFQFNSLSMALAFQYDRLYGDLDEHGFNMGVILRSYAAQKFLLEWRLMTSDVFDEETEDLVDEYDTDTIFESHLELGYMVAPRIEVFAALKYLQDGFHRFSANAITAGVKMHY